MGCTQTWRISCFQQHLGKNVVALVGPGGAHAALQDLPTDGSENTQLQGPCRDSSAGVPCPSSVWKSRRMQFSLQKSEPPNLVCCKIMFSFFFSEWESCHLLLPRCIMGWNYCSFSYAVQFEECTEVKLVGSQG